MEREANDKDICYLGITDWRDVRVKFGIKKMDRTSHIYCLGRSGSGKSTLLLNMIVQDICAGKSVAVFDPHSDLVEKLLHYIPKDRVNDFIYLNAADQDYPIGFNPLANVKPAFHHLAASGILSTFKKYFDGWGGRMEHILRFALMTLLEYGDATLLDIQPLLTNEVYRRKVLSRISSPYLLSFWQNEYGGTGAFRADIVSPIVNKLGILVANTALRNIFGQKKSFSMQDVMNGKKVLLINCAKGLIGEDGCGLLGCMLLGAIQNAALFRSSIPEHERIPFHVYIDEAQLFVTTTIAEALSESKKYALCLVIANQFLDQLQEDIRASIFGNTGTKIVFSIGATDARYMAKEFFPLCHESDFIHLGRHCMYVRLQIDGSSSAPFSAKSLPPAPIKQSFRDKVVAASRAVYGTPKSEVDNLFLLRYHPNESPNKMPSLF